MITAFEDDLRAAEDEPLQEFALAACALAATGEALWSAAALSFGSKLSQHRFDWMKNPRPGDMVFVYMAFQHPLHRVGVYRGVWTFLGEESDEGADWLPFTERAREQVFYVETLDGRGMKWANVQLLRIPRNDAEHREFLGSI